jgi:cobalt/nickel transport protein
MVLNRSSWMIAAAAALVAAPLLLPGLQGEFKGTDDLGSAAVSASHPDYQPWFQPLWKPPSGEIESMLFALEAGLGGGLLGYVIGRRHSRSRDDVADR